MNHLMIFAKYPEPGRVKTRLAATIGFHQAAVLYRRMVERVIDQTRPLHEEYQQILCFDPIERRNDFERWFPSLALLPQEGDDLGQRMMAALERSFVSGAGRALIIGTDCIQIDSSLIREALGRLANHDLVLGPARDGGYTLIGCKKIHPELFREIPWSTAQVLRVTLEGAKEKGLRSFLLPPLEDIDTVEDDRGPEDVSSLCP